MTERESFIDYLSRRGISRRGFLGFCAVTASALALPMGAARTMAANLAAAQRPCVIWLSFQECTGCTESLTRAAEPTIESLILDQLSLDYHHTLQAASGEAAELARQNAIDDNFGSYVLIVDGAVPTGEQATWSTIAGQTNLDMLKETLDGAALVIAVGTCATFGGVPAAAAIAAERPNQSGAKGVGDLMSASEVPERPLVNVPGCPPVPGAMTGVIAHFLAFGTPPELDDLRRPVAYFADTVHQRCPRLMHFRNERFALAFDDEGARNGYCLAKLGCKGPKAHNACATLKWNLGTSFPMLSGHGCLGCAEPGFWDRTLAPEGDRFLGSAFYPDAPPAA
ncbi:MAG: hydrogenase small subunit [Thiohalocapsa sp.]|uniref:hydrogenase small subunit n=1 Tax=Thiohalocapsa sp. TaxID=2497641 RepID=UPI0025F03FF3|nr:hydrogenase small subunit [Thiohalocapsa sp.]MCG6941634.1 hydrogenase small subunit [Thiohalocapsa sp.]